eukprot:CAMPEP_0184708124 /NCGR_PEP_ID=MMETSP0313-20130426/37616_1 /TAXON_ID=2792 /ORGANISM="Porphyridium aerugineum, Strain SAG 1380-2" /LENGTH=454 /DNA_ID=CAMNT_0027169707 /DNA_START=23 /DNA_END=1387 /DNA_ORIENTATION=-
MAKLLPLTLLAMSCLAAVHAAAVPFASTMREGGGGFDTGICVSGLQQSPVDIITADTIALEVKNTLTLNGYPETNAIIEDTGSAIKATLDNGGSVTVDGVNYKLLQFHFHGKSEEKIDGTQYDLVVHLVHADDAGNLLVVGVIFEEGSTANPVIAIVLDGVGGNKTLNSEGLLPSTTGSYYHLMGSLTTPPCSEGVRWYIMKDIQSATAEQISAMRGYHADNYRPVQPLNGRMVQDSTKEAEGTPTDPTPTDAPTGPTPTPLVESTCFPADATVELEGGVVRQMHELKIGDRVKVADGQYSDIYFFGHKLEPSEKLFRFVQLSFGNGKALEISEDHLVWINDQTWKRAGSVEIGDKVLDVAGGSVWTPVTQIAIVHKAGLYNPHTLTGDIVVNGFLASTYNRVIHPRLAHWFLAPERSLYVWTGGKVSLLNGRFDVQTPVALQWIIKFAKIVSV